MSRIASIILAAGMGTRMKSQLPKVLHKVAGRSLLGHVLTTANDLGVESLCVVRGPDMENVESETLSFAPKSKFAVQNDRNGTAKAVEMAKAALEGFSGTIIILYGDVPLIEAETLKKLALMVKEDQPLAVLGFEAEDPTNYGRFILAEDGTLAAIREHKDASEQELAINLCNSGIMAVSSDVLWDMLAKVDNDNAAGEYYLTDIVSLVVDSGKKVGAARCNEQEVAGINDRVQLAHMESVLQSKLRAEAMAGGVTLVAPETVYFSADTKLGKDIVIEPNVFFAPGVEVRDGATILANCHIDRTIIGKGAIVGPFARLRPGTVLSDKAKIGNFVETKNAEIHHGAKVNHLTYIGDATVGEKSNIGAGTITCNYDGFGKHRTEIGKGAFIGSNSSLIAPVTIGDGAYVGSATVVTNNVPGDALGLSRAPQTNKEGWAKRFRAAKTRNKQGN